MANKNKRQRKGLYKSIGRDLTAAGNLAKTAFDLTPLTPIDEARSAATTDVLNRLNTLSTTAGQRSPEMIAQLARMQDLTQGYDAQEMNALRQQRRQELERGFQAGQAGLMRGQSVARTGATQRGAQLLQLAKNYGEQSSAAENDLFVQGAKVKRDAIGAYGEALGGQEQNEYTRQSDALQNYNNALSGAETTDLDKMKFNRGQEAASRALNIGATTGLLGIGESRRAAKRQNKLIKEGYRSNEKIANIYGNATKFAAEIASLMPKTG